MSEKERRFRPGDPLNKLMEAAYLNTLEERLARIENIVGGKGIHVVNTGQSIGIKLIRDIPEIEFVQLTTQLAPDGEETVNVLKYNTTSEIFEDSNIQFEGLEICGRTSLDNTRGLLITLPRGTEKKRIFIPWPLAQGDDLPGYDFEKQQALTHDANGYLRWLEIRTCPTSSSTSSSSSGL